MRERSFTDHRRVEHHGFSLGVRENHSVVAVPSEIVPRPVHYHDDPVAQADQEDQV